MTCAAQERTTFKGILSTKSLVGGSCGRGNFLGERKGNPIGVKQYCVWSQCRKTASSMKAHSLGQPSRRACACCWRPACGNLHVCLRKQQTRSSLNHTREVDSGPGQARTSVEWMHGCAGDQGDSHHKPVLSEAWFLHAKRFWRCFVVLFPPEVKPGHSEPLVFTGTDRGEGHGVGPSLSLSVDVG